MAPPPENSENILKKKHVQVQAVNLRGVYPECRHHFSVPNTKVLSAFSELHKQNPGKFKRSVVGMRDRFHRRFAKPSELQSCEIVYHKQRKCGDTVPKKLLNELWFLEPLDYGSQAPIFPIDVNAHHKNALVFAHRRFARVLIP